MTLWVLQLVTTAALAVDAYIHADLAPSYDAIGSDITQGTLFRAEAAVASAAALLLLVAARRRLVWGFAFVVLLSALAALLLYRYVDVGSIGPLPNMYEPAWFPKKTTAAVAEGVGALSAAVGIVAGTARSSSPV